ncbi:MAG TPA: protein kinase [Bauldia sp.]|nr:protein kinase [Bauldia sp.]
MAETQEQRLAEIERRIAAVEEPHGLMRFIEENADLAAAPGEIGVRYAAARGIVLNRTGLPGSARVELQKARDKAEAEGVAALMSGISREIARVHVWRGETTSAALELLRSLVEADAAGKRGDVAASVAEYGRLNLETGRYEAALRVFDRLLDPARGLTEHLSPRERSRLPLNRREAMIGLADYEGALGGIDEVIAATPAEFRRDHFVLRLIKARSLGALGRNEEATAALAEAQKWMAADPLSYEVNEKNLVEGFLSRKTDPEDAVDALENALERFVDDDLPRHEFDARILLAGTLAELGQRDKAERCVIEALQRAEARQLPAMADAVRAAALTFWQDEMIAELAPGDRVGVRDSEAARFLILGALGTGGFGAVQRAIDLATGAEVAIKKLKRRPDATPEMMRIAINTVRNEVHAAARHSSRFVARTRYLHIDEDGGITLVQDFVDGPTLRAALKEGSLTLGRRLAIAATVARAVAKLHQGGIAHRDLKPDNIILRHGRQPVLIDLGLARLKGMVDTAAGLATESYAPREQKEGRSEERWLGREDVYALGKIIAEMTGDASPEAKPRGGLFGFGRKNVEEEGSLADIVARMTVEDVAKREVDLIAAAAALEAASVAAEREKG